jgi:hypothetical protein
MVAVTDLIGGWVLEAAVQHFDDGEVRDEFGPTAHGYLCYTAEGVVSAVLGAGDRTRAAAADPQDSTAREYQEAAQHFIAYSGRFTLDSPDGDVTHLIEASLFLNWEDTAQHRKARIDGDTLSVTASDRVDGAGRRFHVELRWKRATPLLGL